MKRVLSIAVFSLLFILISNSAFGAKRYWIKTTSAIWNDTANWSSTSTGSSGFSVPGVNDTAYFTSSKNGSCTLDVNISVKHLNIGAGYTGTIVQGGYSVTIGTTGAVLSGGTFSGGSAAITLTGPMTISGCAFTSTSGTLTTSSNVTVSSGSFAHNSGTITVTANMTLTSSITGGVTFNNLSFSPTAANATYTITSTTAINISGTLTIGGNKTSTFNTGTLRVQGNLTITAATLSGGGGTGTIILNGTGNQTLTGSGTAATGRLPKVEINKSSGTLSLASTISVGNNWTHNSGTINPGTSTVYIANGSTFTGNLTFYNLTFGTSAGLTIATGSVVTVTNTFYGNCTIINGSGYLDIKGNMTINTTSNYNPSGNVRINGSGTQTINGLSSPFLGNLPNVTIQKSPSDTLKLTGNISVYGGTWKLDSGIVDAGTSTMNINNVTVTGSQTWNNLTISSGAGSIISGSTELTVEGNLIFNTTGSGVSLAGNILNAHGNVTMQHTGINTATQSATIKINGAGTQTLTGSGTAGSGRFCNITIDKTSGVLNLASVISVNGHWNYIKGDVDPGTSTVALYGTFQLDGQEEGTSNMMRFYSLGIGSGTRTLTGNIDINNNFTILSGAACSANGKNMNVGGNWNCQGTFTYSTGTVTFDGNSYNNIKGTAGTTVGFGNVAFNRGAGSVTLQNPMRVNTSMTITKGRIKTTSANYLEFVDNATCTTATHSAYVHGPVRKTGNDAFTFPLGDTTLNDTAAFHPLAITAPGATGDQFEAVYYASGQTLGTTLVDSLINLSTCERWSLERRSGTSNPTVTVSWNANSCNTSSYANLRMAGWNGTQWEDLGATSITVSGNRGSITSTYNLSYVSNVANIAIATKKYTPPYAILRKKLDGGYYQVNNGRLLFRYEEEYEDNSNLTFFIYNDQNQVVSSSQIVPASMQLQVNYGDNRYELNTANCNISADGALDNGFYVLEVINDKNEKWYLRFKQDISILIINCNPTPEEQ